MDAAEATVIHNLAATGRMPNYARLLEEGGSGRITGVPGCYEGSVWPTLCTGMNPGRHGFHWLGQYDRALERIHWNALDLGTRSKAFWTRLNEAARDRKSVLCDLPLFPMQPTEGRVQIAEWGCHDHVYGFATSPSELRATILSKFGPHPLSIPCERLSGTFEGLRSLRDRLIEGVRRRTELTLHLLRTNDWQLFMQVFSESHCAGHHFWHLHDTNHPSFDLRQRTEFGDVIEDVYVEIDAALGCIRDAMPRDAWFFVVATHGMTSSYGYHSLLPEILRRIGFQNISSAREKAGSSSGDSPLPASLRALQSYWRNLSRHTRETWKERLGAIHRRASSFVHGAPLNDPWGASEFRRGNTRIVMVPNGTACSAITVLAAQGRNEAGARLRIVEEIESILETFRDADKRPSVQNYVRPEVSFHGSATATLPDLFIQWNPKCLVAVNRGNGETAKPSMVESSTLGSFEVPDGPSRSGDHIPDGSYVLCGPRAGSHRTCRDASIVDIAPTICDLLDVAHDDMDGESLVRSGAPDL
jgi:predicted AlkP superfamily phosphohydrolase/phosphomutase